MWRTSAAATSSPSSVTQLDPRFDALQRARSRPAMSSENIAWRRRPDAPPIVFSTKLPFLRLPMQPHGHSPTCAAAANRGRRRDPVMRGTLPARRRSPRARPRARAGPPRRRRRRDRDDGDADDRRDEVADRRVLVVAEAVAVEQRVVPEPGVVASPLGHRVEVVLLQVEVLGRVLAERAARCESPSGVSTTIVPRPISAQRQPSLRAGAELARRCRARAAWLMRRIGRLARWR